MRRFSTFVVGIFLLGCNAAEIDKICTPTAERQFNVVYNAHYNGQFSFANSCGDTATVFRTAYSGDLVPPGVTKTYELLRGMQYLVAVDCADSSLTYTFVNDCP